MLLSILSCERSEVWNFCGKDLLFSKFTNITTLWRTHLRKGNPKLSWLSTLLFCSLLCTQTKQKNVLLSSCANKKGSASPQGALFRSYTSLRERWPGLVQTRNLKFRNGNLNGRMWWVRPRVLCPSSKSIWTATSISLSDAYSAPLIALRWSLDEFNGPCWLWQSTRLTNEII